MHKKCSGPCGRVLPRSHFYDRVSRGRQYPASRCKDCTKIYRDAVRAKQREGDFKIDLDLSELAEPLPQNAGDPVFVRPPPLPPLERAKAEHAKAKDGRDLRAEHRALVEENEELHSQLAQVRRLGNPPDFYDYEKEPPTRGSAVACVIASDWHVEEPVDASKVNGLNEYSLEIARARAERFFQNTLILTDIMARDSDIQILYLMFLGDFFTNYLLPEMMQTNELPPEEAARFAQGLLADGIRFLLRNSRYKLEIDCIAGNHGRMTPKMQVSNATGTSLETFMYHALAGLFHDEPRVTFRIANSKMLYRRFFEKFTLRLIHGDDIRYQGGIGGVTIPLRKKIAQWDKSIRAHLTCLGHFHQRQDGGDFLVNGSLIGYNEFASTIGASPEAPVQSFFLIHNRNGGEKSITAPIWVDR